MTIPGVKALWLPALFAVTAYIMAPFSHQPTRVTIPEGADLDAVQQTLLVTTLADTLISKPSAYYNTAILYPDHNQLRSTEPFLGFAVAALPLHVALRLSDVETFEVMRWLLTFAALCYVFLFLRALNVSALMAVTGALLCVWHPNILRRIESLQILSIPLIFAVLYHGVMLWTSQGSRRLHGVLLFVWVAAYPLLGVINAGIVVMAALLMLPLSLKALSSLRRDEWPALLWPVGAAVLCDAVVLWPWLRDRADLAGYVSREFLQIKHWNAMDLPGNGPQVLDFLAVRVGWSLGVALLVSLVMKRDRPRWYLAALPFLAIALCVIYVAHAPGRVVVWTTMAFQIGCYAALVAYWRDQLRLDVRRDPAAMRELAVLVSGGLTVFLCLLSFGPVAASNDSLLATDLAHRLLIMLPPLQSLREFARIWAFAMMAAAVWMALRLDVGLRGRSAVVQAASVTVVSLGLLLTVYDRQTLVASEEIIAPPEIVQLASHSHGAAGMYVHPLMRWNTSSAVRMVAAARDTGRPIVNGCLGIVLPWFPYAARVLERFPDEESLWLMRRWHVDTVIDLDPAQHGVPPPHVTKAFEDADGATWDIGEGVDVAHPSEPASSDATRFERVDIKLDESANRGPMTLKVPQGFVALAVEVHFALSAVVVDQMPTSIDVWSTPGNGDRIRVNAGQSGQWLESLAADALLHRKAPVATIRLSGPQTHDLQLERRGDGKAPIASVTLIGVSLR